MVQCPNCHHIFRSDDQDEFFRGQARVEQATSAPGELRTVTRPPAHMPSPEDHGPNAGDEDETGNG